MTVLEIGKYTDYIVQLRDYEKENSDVEEVVVTAQNEISHRHLRHPDALLRIRLGSSRTGRKQSLTDGWSPLAARCNQNTFKNSKIQDNATIVLVQILRSSSF
jgi:hypothetical protein